MEQEGPSVTIRSIRFKNGQKIGFNNDDIVLLVGANNAGKSRTLKDLQEDLIDTNGNKILIDKVEYQTKGFTSERMRDYFQKNVDRDRFGNYNVIVQSSHTYSFSDYDLNNILQNPKNFYKVLFSFLSTENRLYITRPIRFGGVVDQGSLNIMKKIERSPNLIKTLNNMLVAGFGRAIEVYNDCEGGIALKEYRIGDKDEIDGVLGANRRDALAKLEDLESLQEQGDGVRSAVAILASLTVNSHSLFLIDEPETFLHPPQAKLIGKNIVSVSEGKQCFVATHDIDFIRGVIEADSSRVKVIKIDRTGNQNTFNVVSNESIMGIANDKNLKYTNILNGLFYDKLVLCENESDCKFYSAILENLDLSKYQNTLFCAVGGKYQFKKVIPLLKELSIQYVIIADIDLIDNKNVLGQLLDAIAPNSYDVIKEKHASFLDKLEDELHSRVKTQATIKKEINGFFDSNRYITAEVAEKIKSTLRDTDCLKQLKSGGKNILPQGECVSLYNEIIDCLRGYKVHVVECGEIERFVSEIGGHGDLWLKAVFEKYPDINNSVYDGAKAFVKQVFSLD